MSCLPSDLSLTDHQSSCTRQSLGWHLCRPTCLRKVLIFKTKSEKKKTLRAKGTLISEPRFSTPREMRFFPREKGKMAFVEGFSLKRPFSLSRMGKIASRRGVENRGSLISVPLALREGDKVLFKMFFSLMLQKKGKYGCTSEVPIVLLGIP